MKDENLQDALGVWRDLSRSQAEILAYESRLKYILDEEAKLGDARYFAEKEGIEKGKLLEKEETVKQLFKLSLTVEQIVGVTSLDSAIVEQIIKELSGNK